MASITLDKDLGVNPGIMGCENCKETYGVALYGSGGYKKECGNCGVVNICKAGQKECGKCHMLRLGSPERLRSGEIVYSGLCTKCEKSFKDVDKEVRNGGIHWKCKYCRSTGALKAGTDLAMVVRKQANIKAPNPVGIEFSKEEMCPVCSDSIVAEKEES